MTFLGIGIGMGAGRSGGGPRVPPYNFPLVFDGNDPVLDLWYDEEFFLLEGVEYTSLADFIAAGGADVGSGHIAAAKFWNPPHTWRLEAVAPAAYNAGGRNYAFALYGADTAHYIYLRLDQTSGKSQYQCTNSTSQWSTPVLENVDTPDGELFTASGSMGTNLGRYSSQARAILSDTSSSMPTISQGLALGYTPFGAGGEWNGEIKRFTMW